jgi:hypothetical protein
VLFRLIFNILSTDSSTGPIQEDVAWGSDLFPEQNCALKRIFSDKDSNQRRPTIPTSWARAREYRDGEAGYLQERAWHLIRTCEIASLQLRGTIGRWRKLSKALPIKGQTKGQTNRASLQDGSRDHLTGTYRREAMRVMRQRESPSGLRSICDRQRSNS